MLLDQLCLYGAHCDQNHILRGNYGGRRIAKGQLDNGKDNGQAWERLNPGKAMGWLCGDEQGEVMGYMKLKNLERWQESGLGRMTYTIQGIKPPRAHQRRLDTSLTGAC